MKQIIERLRANPFHVRLVVLLILHVVGAVGLVSPWSKLFLGLTPFNLLLSGFILLLGWEKLNPKVLISILLVFVLGWTAEYLGAVHGLIFGQYAYGSVLGWKLAEVPLIIGVNWVLVMFGAHALVSSFGLPSGLRILLGAFLAVSLDWLIEPVAVALDFWQWEGGEIPFSNYMGWFGLSALFIWMMEGINGPTNNRTARALFLILVAFFGFLRVTV